MSYVIQHFYRLSPVNRLTYRRYFNWLARNTALIWFLINYLNINSNVFLKSFKDLMVSPQLLKSFFSKGLIKLFTKSSLKWRPVRESQWVRGSEYWSYKLMSQNFLNDQLLTKPLHLYTTNYFYNQPLLEKRYMLISFSQKYYRVVLVNFLHLLIKSWQFWRTQLVYTMNSLLITNEFFILRFLNTRLFKVYFV